MTILPPRVIRSWQSIRVLPDLIQSIFAAEILSPSGELWLVSPWVSDIPVLDNRAGEYTVLVPTWDRIPIRLSQVLLYLAGRSTRICVATRNDDHNQPFLHALHDKVTSSESSIQIREAPLLHEKGLLGGNFFLSGSFNFTYYGITLNEEIAYLYTDPTLVAENSIAFRERWTEGW